MKEDFNRLRLKHHGDPVKMDEILQRECRYKTAAKLPETLRCGEFRFPSLAVAEMSTSDAVADIHATMIAENTRILDMTCGLGIDAFRFARKAAEVTAVELDHTAYITVCHNAKALGVENIRIVEGDSIAWLAGNNEHFDTIFIDPARRDSAGRHFALRDCSPDIIPAMPLLMSRCSTLIVKASPMIDIKSAVNELGRNCAVTTIGTAKECKEVVFTVSADEEETTQPEITEINCITAGHSGITFTPAEESSATPTYAIPEAGGYLYEPYPSVMKGGGMRLLSERFGIAKLHPNTHLFTSEKPVDGFPGEIFEIAEIYPFSKQGIKAVAKAHPTINVATRNFPLSAPQLAAKLKIKEGGDKMLFGVTASDGSRLLIITAMGKAL